jgi:hypothetical protein
MKIKFWIGKEVKDEKELSVSGNQNSHFTFFNRLPKDEKNNPDLIVEGVYIDEKLVMIFTRRKDTE